MSSLHGFKTNADLNDLTDGSTRVEPRNGPSPPAFYGVPLKHISLVALAVQNSLLTVVMHHSRVSTPISRTYSAATAVLVNEVLKGLISIIIALSRYDTRLAPPTYLPEAQQPRRQWSFSLLLRCKWLFREVFSPDVWKLSIPAILYVIQNNLQYVAATELEAAPFQVAYQMKILTTAGFSVLILRKSLSVVQWISLVLLAIGVAVVQTGTIEITVSVSDHSRALNPGKGFLAVVAACCTSGLAGVYFEKVLKNSQCDLWVRNIQLSLFSLLPAIAPVVFDHGSIIELGVVEFFHRIFHDFGFWAWTTVAIQVCGGLVTAMVIKYADNILKGFATSLSIVLSFVASVALFKFHMSVSFLVGSAIVLNATWLYNQQPSRSGILAALDSATLARKIHEKWKGHTRGAKSESLPGHRWSRSSSVVSLSSMASPVNTVSSINNV